MKMKRRGLSFFLTLSSLVLLLVIGGCSTSTVPAPEAEDALAPVPTMVGGFDDIELPAEMKYEVGKSMSLKNDAFRGGVYYFKGKVDVGSLKEFIAISMKNKKWKLDGENVMKKDSVLAFTKPNKTAMYIITDDVQTTKLTLVVTANLAASSRMNPFGEPVN